MNTVNAHVWWYAARASGIVAYLMLTASVLWGIFLSTRLLQHRRRPAWLLDLHRRLGALTLAFVGIHVGALIADSYTHFTLTDVLVPYATSWKPGAVALGIVAGWLLVAVEVTSLLTTRLPRRAWRAVHLTSYATFWLTSLHGTFAGTDATQPLYQGMAVLSITALVFAVAYRVLTRRPRSRSRLGGTAEAAVPAR